MLLTIWRAFRKEDLPENYFRGELTVLRYIGIEIIKEPSKLYKIYSTCFLLYIVYIYPCTELLELYSNWNNIDNLTKVLFYLGTHGTGILKVSLMVVNRGKLKNMILALHSGIFRPTEEIEEIYIRKVIRATEIQLGFFYFGIMCVASSGVAESLKVRLTEPSEKWHMPLMPVTFFNLNYSPIFEICCFSQAAILLIIAFFISSIDLLRASIIAHISAQMKILQNAFRTIKARAERLRKEENNGHSLEFYVERLLGECVTHHLQTFVLVTDMEEICSIVVLMEILLNMGQLCFILYQTSTAPIGGFSFFEKFCSWCVIVIQPFLYCYWGNEVSLEAENVYKAAAEIDWVGLPNSVTKSLVLVMARAQRPTLLTAGGFVILSLETFTKIIKGSFSYCMLLRQMNQKELTK